ncbi:hypothetical protein J4417_04715 [Candidatus Woesearchaeota archaeon]|nr:hypothetical protein [Candidatus Woesearchaeota archaeon]
MIKRGQITIFIILGVVILLILGGAVFFLQYSSKSKLDVSKEQVDSVSGEAAAVKVFVESCLKKIGKEAISFVSIQGGYYNPSEPYFEYAGLKIPYFFDKKAMNVPTKQKIEEESSLYIQKFLNNCLKNNKDISYTEEKKVKVMIAPQTVLVSLEMPVTIESENKLVEIKDFQVKIPGEIGLATEVIPLIIAAQKEYPNRVRLSELVAIGEEKKVLIDLTHFNNTVFYNLKYSDSMFNQETYTFTFAMKYNWTE